MSSDWQIEEAGPRSAEWNMQVDQDCLLKISSPWLRFYEWESLSATYGYFLDPWDYFDSQGVFSHSLQLARRPTGGGVIFHTCDLAFSIGVPASHRFYTHNTLESYAQINQRVLLAVHSQAQLSTAQNSSRGGFCMTQPTIYDLMLDGRKVGGSAQRKTKQGLLHQGSLCLTLPSPLLLRGVLKPHLDIYENIKRTSYPLASQDSDLVHLRAQLKQKLIQSLTSR